MQTNELDQKLQKKVKYAFNEINKIISPLNNSLLALDFSYITLNDSFTNKYKIKGYFYGVPSYKEIIMEDFFMKYGAAVNLKSPLRIILNTVNPVKPYNLHFIESSMDYEGPVKICSLETWNNYLKEKAFSGCWGLLYHKIENVEIGIYFMFEKQIENYENKFNHIYEYDSNEVYEILHKNNSELYLKKIQSHIIIRDIFQTLDDCLLSEGIEIGVIEKLTMQKYQEELISHRHSIFNLNPLDYQDTAREYYQNQNYKLAFEYFSDAHKTSELLNIILHNAFKPDSSHPLRDKSIIQIISYLKDKHIVSSNEFIKNRIPKIDIINSDNDFIINETNQLIDAFTVLFNLWHNASKKYDGYNPDYFFVSADSFKNNLIISFRNEGHLNRLQLDFLNDKIHEFGELKRQGLKIIREKCKKSLNWDIKANSNDGWVEIVLTINKRRNEYNFH